MRPAATLCLDAATLGGARSRVCCCLLTLLLLAMGLLPASLPVGLPRVQCGPCPPSYPTHPPSAYHLREVYDLLSPGFTGRCTAPLLVDKKARRAVCNESSLIARNFADLATPPPGAPAGTAGVDLVPAQLLPEIEHWNGRIYDTGEQ